LLRFLTFIAFAGLIAFPGALVDEEALTALIDFPGPLVDEELLAALITFPGALVDEEALAGLRGFLGCLPLNLDRLKMGRGSFSESSLHSCSMYRGSPGLTSSHLYFVLATPD
jgi:hypothetical protein